MPNIRIPRIFLLYWALILPLGGYLAYDYCTDYSAELEPVLARTVAAGQGIAWQSNLFTIHSIDVTGDVYHYSQSQRTVSHKVWTMLRFVDSCQASIRPGSLNGTNVNVTDLNAFDCSQRAILQKSLYANLALSAEEALYFQNERLSGPFCGVLRIQPEMTPQIACIPAGQQHNAEVFLNREQFGIGLGLKKVWVNGAQIPIEDGLGKFTATFNKPGPQDLHLRIEARGFCRDTVPRIYEKTYTVNVQ